MKKIEPVDRVFRDWLALDAAEKDRFDDKRQAVMDAEAQALRNASPTPRRTRQKKTETKEARDVE
jgi:hypothetical protein